MPYISAEISDLATLIDYGDLDRPKVSFYTPESARHGILELRLNQRE
jgi:hypothetical protein